MEFESKAFISPVINARVAAYRNAALINFHIQAGTFLSDVRSWISHTFNLSYRYIQSHLKY
jgi:hypothetical protein